MAKNLALSLSASMLLRVISPWPDRSGEVLFLLTDQVAVVHVIDFEQLAQIVAVDEAALARGRHAGAANGGHLHVGLERGENQVLATIDLAQAGQDFHLAAEAGDVIGRGNDAAGKELAVPVLGGNKVLLGGFSKGRHIVIFVDDGIADQKHLVIAHAFDHAEQLVGDVALALQLQIAPQLGVVDIEKAVEQRRRAEGDVVGEEDAPAAGLDGSALVDDLAGRIVLGLGIVRALGIDIGLQGTDHVLRRRRLVDRHPIHVAERGQHLGAQGGGEDGPARPFVDVSIACDGDDQNVAFRAGLLQVTDMTHVKQVEGAVSEHDPKTPGLRLGNDIDQFVERLDLGPCRGFRLLRQGYLTLRELLDDLAHRCSSTRASSSPR
jgi:hypothetical protein